MISYPYFLRKPLRGVFGKEKYQKKSNVTKCQHMLSYDKIEEKPFLNH